ncbi:MAG: hypothetical protein LC116_00780 [Bacteroidetes bacterium]|nr:hypothetical protein [Bacteroidota bacterium]
MVAFFMENYRELEDRLNVLERHNKKLRRWLGAVALCAFALAAGGWAVHNRTLSIDKIETNDLTITDSKGMARIRMQTSPDNDLATIRIFGSDTSVSIISMGSSIKYGASSITFTDTKGRRRLAFTVEQDTNVLVNVYNPKGKISAALAARGSMSSFYGGMFVAIDSAGNSRLMAGTTAEEKYEPFLYFYDREGRQRTALNARDNGIGLLKFNDENGRATSAIGTQPKTRGFVVTLDTNGKSLWGSP